MRLRFALFVILSAVTAKAPGLKASTGATGSAKARLSVLSSQKIHRSAASPAAHPKPRVARLENFDTTAEQNLLRVLIYF